MGEFIFHYHSWLLLFIRSLKSIRWGCLNSCHLSLLFLLLLLLLLLLLIGNGDGCRLSHFSFFFFFFGFFCYFFFFFFRSVMVIVMMLCVILLWCAGVVLVLIIFYNIAVKVYKFAVFFFLLKLLSSVDEVAVGLFYLFCCACLVSVE